VFYTITYLHFPTYITIYAISDFLADAALTYLSVICCGQEAQQAFELLRECESLRNICLVFVSDFVSANK